MFLASMAVAGTAFPAVAAPIVIDTFESPATGKFYSTGASSPQVFTDTAPPGTILGTERTATFTRTSGTKFGLGDGGLVGVDDGSLTSFPGASILQFNTGTAGNVNLLYDGVGSGGLGGLDLYTGNLGFQFDFLTVNSGKMSNDVAVTITVGTTGGSLSFSGAIPESVNPSSFVVPFTAFTGGPATNFTSVTSISITLNSDNANNTDLTLDTISIQATPPTPPIPEPASLATWGLLGLAGAWYGRRRLRRQQPA